MTEAAKLSQRRVEGLPVDQLVLALRAAIAGPAGARNPQVIWSDRGSQILLDVMSLQVHLSGTLLVVAIDTETRQFGKAPLIVRFVFGDGKDAASRVAVTDETAHGHPSIAARWGTTFRDVIWAAIVRLAVTSASAHGLQPGAIAVQDNNLQFIAEPPVSIPDLARAHISALQSEVSPS